MRSSALLLLLSLLLAVSVATAPPGRPAHSPLDCKACQWVVSRARKELVEKGCVRHPTHDKFRNLCAALPYEGRWTVPECVAMFDWGCGKLLGLLVNGVKDPKQLCHDVFPDTCKHPPHNNGPQ
jgi:hypothetical protein